MPPEHLMMIDPNALGSLRLECNKCHAAFYFRLTEKVDTPLHCFACREPFSGDGNPAAVEAVRHLLDAFGEWAKVTSSTDARFNLRLEMSPMTHTAPRQSPKP